VLISVTLLFRAMSPPRLWNADWWRFAMLELHWLIVSSYCLVRVFGFIINTVSTCFLFRYCFKLLALHDWSTAGYFHLFHHCCTCSDKRNASHHQ